VTLAEDGEPSSVIGTSTSEVVLDVLHREHASDVAAGADTDIAGSD
jgi:hypothetical protein